MDMHPFLRTEWLIGKDSLKKLAESKVAVFGVGGVGSYAAEGLARSGVGSLVLVDSESIHPTNLNRQIHATVDTLGRPKVEVMKDRILSINPQARVEACQEFYSAESAGRFFGDDWDYVVDAIDSVSSKIDLILRAKEKGIPVISSMGAGNKLDPTRFRIADIYETTVCPLAKVMRRELRKRSVDSLKVVFSTEEPLKPLYDGEGRVPGSVAFVPSVAGLIIAGEVVKDLIGNRQVG